MSNLLNEAVVDVKMLKEAAEENAKNKIIDALTPVLRNMIDKQLMNEHTDMDDGDDILSELLGEVTDTSEETEELNESSDTETSDSDEVINLEEVKADYAESKDKAVDSKKLQLCVEAFKRISRMQKGDLDKKGRTIKESVLDVNLAMELIRPMRNLINEENEVELQVFEKVRHPIVKEVETLQRTLIHNERDGILSKLQVYVENLEKELTDMSTRSKRTLNEEDILLRLGLPDDLGEELDLSDLEVEIVSDDEDAEGMDDMEGGDDVDDFGGDMEAPVDDMEAPLDDEEDDEMPALESDYMEMEEMDDMDDDEVVEIDEAELKLELDRLRAITQLREVDDEVLEDFGGASTLREPFVDSSDSDLNTQDGESGRAPGAMVAEAKRLAANNRKLKRAYKKRGKMIQTLKEHLEDMNLFNAKLLYLNKLLHRGALSESATKKVVNSLDRAQTLREVRLLYKSYSDMVAKPKAEQEATTLKEGILRKGMGGSSQVTTRASKKSGDNASQVTQRWATLAGLGADEE